VRKGKFTELCNVKLINVGGVTVSLTALLAGQPAIFLKLAYCRTNGALTCPNLTCDSSDRRPANTSSLLKSARRAMMATLDNFMPEEAQASQT
jgi:hypothetical protein